MKVNNRIRWIIITLLLVSCEISTIDTNKKGKIISQEATDFYKQNSHESAVVYSTFKEILENSYIILKGRAIQQKGVINSARDPNDLSKEDPNYFGIGQVYEVAVEEYLKGDGPTLINVVQNEGFILTQPEVVSEKEIELARSLSSSLPLSVDKRYIMFLASSELTYSGYKNGELFIGRGHPWKFEITTSDCVLPDDYIVETHRFFPPISLDRFVNHIIHPETFSSMTYPESTDSLDCLIENSNTYP